MTRPRGRPPTPSAMSRPTRAGRDRADLGDVAARQRHDRALAELLFDGRDGAGHRLQFLLHAGHGSLLGQVVGWSRTRYCRASARWAVAIAALPPRSAIVRATRRTRVIARADSPSRAAARSSSACPRRRAAPPAAAPSTTAARCSAGRAPAAARAPPRRGRGSAALDSPGSACASSRYGSAGTSTCRSMRSSSGPDSRDAVGRDGRRRADAGADRAAEVPARAGVQRRDQHEVGRVGDAAARRARW